MSIDQTGNRERFLSTILDSIQDGISVLSADLTVLYTNQVMEEWYAANMPLVGKKCYQCYHGKNHTCDPCPSLRTLESGFADFEVVTGLPGSEAKWLELFTFPMRDESGPITGVVEYVRDVTARVEAQEKLRQHAERLAILREIDKAILSAHSVQEISDRALTRIRSLLSAYRVSLAVLDEETGMAEVAAVAQRDDLPVGKGEMVPLESFGPKEYLARPVVWIDDLSNWPHKADAQRRLIEAGIRSVMLVPLRVENELIGILKIGYDRPKVQKPEHREMAVEVANQLAIAIRQAHLTEKIEQQNAQLELRVAKRTEQLQASNRALEEFAYSVSHDLKAPLRAIRGFAEIIAQRHKESLDEEARHYFDNIIEASGRMADLISDLLAYSRLGKGSMPKRTVDLDTLIREVLSEFETKAKHLGARITVHADLPSVWANPTLLSQVFGNLIDNALKYRRDDVAPAIDITARTEGGQALVSVSDNGIGIAENHLDKIFDIFQRLHSRETYPGTGIGLATVRKAVTLMGGNVTVTSQPGKGSVFTVELPTDRRDQA